MGRRPPVRCSDSEPRELHLKVLAITLTNIIRSTSRRRGLTRGAEEERRGLPISSSIIRGRWPKEQRNGFWNRLALYARPLEAERRQRPCYSWFHIDGLTFCRCKASRAKRPLAIPRRTSPPVQGILSDCPPHHACPLHSQVDVSPSIPNSNSISLSARREGGSAASAPLQLLDATQACLRPRHYSFNLPTSDSARSGS